MKRARLNHRPLIAVAVIALASSLVSSLAISADQDQQVSNGQILLTVNSFLPDELITPPRYTQLKMVRWSHLIGQETFLGVGQEPMICHNQESYDQVESCRLNRHQRKDLFTSRKHLASFSFQANRRLGNNRANYLELEFSLSPEVRLRYNFD